ncbi:MAG: PTS sugar transporter subunit IIA [Deltaproteobacteria bacterium]|nr:PTS sugar transporter subunit IIA [Deltaproteobacteria bacterium]
MRLDELTRPELIFQNVEGAQGPQLLKAVSSLIHQAGVIGDAEGLYLKLQEREELGSTGIGGGVAIPHCKLKDLTSPILTIAVAREKVEFAALDGQPVQVFFVLLSPEASPASHLQVLSSVSRWLQKGRCVDAILDAKDRQAVFQLLGASNGDECP